MRDENRAALAGVLLPVFDVLEMQQLAFRSWIHDVKVARVVVHLVAVEGRELSRFRHLIPEFDDSLPVRLDRVEAAYELRVAAPGIGRMSGHWLCGVKAKKSK